MPDLALPRNWGHAGTRKTWLRRRDGDACHLCGLAMTFARAGRSPDDATIDHIVPKSAGGGDAATNLRLAHKRCNEARGNLSMEEWAARREAVKMQVRAVPVGERLERRLRRELIRRAARQGIAIEWIRPL